MAERNRQHPVMRALIYAVLFALLATGLVWKLDVERALLMKIHGAAAMASMLLFGALLAQHVPRGWKARANRNSGATLLAGALWLVVSGYALYYSGSEPLRAFASQTHFWIGVAFAVVLGLHHGAAA
jgi:peptidoglycan/LPS O-acetylase OafA/YrhL